ncbi:MAG: acyl-CoA thioesterase [Anaerolineae bacterium]|nr:acyl-CoA thioesterase [Anaerolineae bacterium]
MLSSPPLTKVPESTLVARFQDCDPFGHLNNARYIDYFLNAREEHLAAHYGLHLYEHTKQTSEGWVVTNTQISYLRPVGVMEEVLIRTCLLQFSDTSLTVEGVMLDPKTFKVKSVCWMQFTYVSLATGRTIKHPDDLISIFTNVVIEDVFATGFPVRVEALRKTTSVKTA